MDVSSDTISTASPPTSDTSYSLSQRSGHDSRKTLRRSQSAAEPRAEASKGGFFSRVKDWVFTSEPSTHALKQRRKEAFQKAGLLLDDPKAAAKLHAPLGEIPESAIKPAGRGPFLEKQARKAGEPLRDVGSNNHKGHRSGQDYSRRSGSTSSTGKAYLTDSVR